MFRRFWMGICCIIAALMVAVAASAPVQARATQRIVAVGDLHGDYPAWIAIARDAGLIDSKNRWTGGRTILVQTGDIVDRGPDSLKIIKHLRKLEKEAARAGGRVIVMVGNHEAMNVTGDLRYVDPGEYAAFVNQHSAALRDTAWQANGKIFIANYKRKFPQMSDKEIRAAWFASTPLGLLEHQSAWAPTGELGRWAIGLPAVVKLGDTLFVHAGLSAPYAGLPIDEINRRVSAALAARETAMSSIINDPLGPLWYRGLITRGAAFEQEVAAAAVAAGAPAPVARPSIEAELDMVLKAYGARRLVIGHTPNVGGIAISHGGKLVRIDTGISRFYRGQLNWLEIVGNRLTPHLVARP